MNIVIISITSDIGSELAKRYTRDNNTVIGTYRTTPKVVDNFSYLLYCDIDDDKSVYNFSQNYMDIGLVWDLLILCPCNPLPIKPFFDCDFDVWRKSVHTNSIGQLHVVHQLYPFRRNGISTVVFFAAGGVNNPVANLSSYTASKIMLIKMCELLDFENKDINTLIIGPGFTKTKIHKTILDNSSGEVYEKTLQYVSTKDGTNIDDIYNSINWLCSQGKIVSGRNFSVVNDTFDEEMLATLDKDSNMYKLRRYGN